MALGQPTQVEGEGVLPRVAPDALDRLRLRKRQLGRCDDQIAVPDLVLYLVADLPTCMSRINTRERSFEKTISEEYMSELIDAYHHYYHYYNRSPLVYACRSGTVEIVDLMIRSGADMDRRDMDGNTALSAAS